MNSTAVTIYEPPISLSWYSLLIVFGALSVVSAIFPNKVKKDQHDGDWLYTGMIINLRGVPDEVGKVAEKAGVVYTNLYEREYPSGKLAWRVKINDKFYYLSKTLVRLKATPA